MPDSNHLTPAIYRELRLRAAQLCRVGGPIAPTSLVHEAFEKLYHVDPEMWTDSVHFKATAATAMRQILLDRVKAGKRQKRGGGELERVPLSQVCIEGAVDVVELSNALEALAAERPRAAQVAQYRLLGGMDVLEMVEVMGISASTVKREWRLARAYLLTCLAG